MIMPGEETIATVCRQYDVGFLALFGSRATGEGTPKDTDIAVSLGRRPEAREEFDLFYALVRLFETDKLDVVILDKASPVLLKEVALHGRPLYERQENAFDNFIMSALAKYQDTKENRRIANNLIGEFLKERRYSA